MKNDIGCIYIVDDDAITIFGIKKALNEVVTCDDMQSFGNGKEALTDLRSRIEQARSLPDIIFLDINMPIMDGWGFLEEFHKLCIDKSIRINIITSSIDSADYEKWLLYKKKSHHFIDYKNKPIFKISPQDIAFLNRAS